MKWLWKLTGGRPMKVGECLFVDRVTGKEVRAAVDKFGRRWMVDSGPWDLGRVERSDLM